MTNGFAITVRTFGTFCLTVDGKLVEKWRAGKARNLLQFLLLHRNQTVSHEQLHNSLWPNSAIATNSSSLKVAVHALRKSLNQARTSSSSSRDSSLQVSTQESGYRLDAHNVWIDYSEFESQIDKAHKAQRRGDLHVAEELYTTASDLYHGDFLPCVLDEDWAATQREWLRSRQLLALRFLSESRRAQGDHLSVIDICKRMLAIDPLYESAYRTLIAVHAELGHLVQVQRWYSLCTTRLREVLQVAPEDQTQHLYEQALHGRQPARAIRL